MEYIKFLLFLCCCIPSVSVAQLTLTIEINDLRNDIGHVHLELSNEDEQCLVSVTENISDHRCVIIIENLESGKYAFRYFHDENMNEQIDTNWLGIPKEGIGFSNDPGMTFGPPSFRKTLFDLSESPFMKSKPKYFF